MSLVEAVINSRRPLRVPSPGNISTRRGVETDRLLETLHSSLRQQQFIYHGIESRDHVDHASSPLSGAITRSVGRNETKTQPDKKSSAAKAERPVPPEVSRSLARAKELMASLAALGLEDPSLTQRMKQARLALTKRQFKTASTSFKRVGGRARETLKRELPVKLAQGLQAASTLERHGGDASRAAELLDSAKHAVALGKYAQAIQPLIEATRQIREGEHEVVLRRMFSAKERFVHARKAGIDIERPLAMMKASREKLKQGKLEESIRLAEEGQRLVDTLLKRERVRKGQMAECIRAIKVADLLGVGSDEINARLEKVRSQFKSGELDLAAENARALGEKAKKASYDKAASNYELAEKALSVAKNLGLEDSVDDETLKLARQSLENDDALKSFSLSTSVIVNTSSFILDSLNDKIKSVAQFAKGIEGEVMSLTEVQEAIEHTKERSVESFRKYSQLSEELVNQAFESAISYTRVSQDVVKEAFNNSIAMTGGKTEAEGELSGKVGSPAEIVSSTSTSPEDKRLRIVNLYLDGRITESQLEKLLTLIDSSVAKINLV